MVKIISSMLLPFLGFGIIGTSWLPFIDGSTHKKGGDVDQKYENIVKNKNYSIYNTKTKNSGLTPDGTIKIFVIKKNSFNFSVSTEKPKNKSFYLNSNFFNTKDDPIGLVVINKKAISKREKYGGYFYVKNGIPYISPYYSPKMTEYNSQTILVPINKGVLNPRLLKQKHSKEKTYRSLIGEDNKGNIVVVASHQYGVITIEEISKIALEFGVIKGISFDGGSSLDYSFMSIKFKSMTSFVKRLLSIEDPPIYIIADIKK